MALKDIIHRKGSTELAPTERANPFAMLRAQMDQLMEDFWREWPGISPAWQTRGGFVPTVDVSEDEKNVHVTAELPGMSEKDIDVSLSSDGIMLTIKGEKKVEEEEKEESFYRFERSYGSFKRTVSLPSAVDDKKADAKFKDGVLHIRFSKLSEEQQGIKKIAVKGG